MRFQSGNSPSVDKSLVRGYELNEHCDIEVYTYQFAFGGPVAKDFTYLIVGVSQKRVQKLKYFADGA